jgi:hypothetical protein
MAGNSHITSFERALKEFKKDLKKRDQDVFKNTTLDGLKQCIGDLQKEQHSSRRLQNLNRLKPFIEAMEQYGKVVTIFANTNEILAFVWVGEISSKYRMKSSYECRDRLSSCYWYGIINLFCISHR